MPLLVSLLRVVFLKAVFPNMLVDENDLGTIFHSFLKPFCPLSLLLPPTIK